MAASGNLEVLWKIDILKIIKVLVEFVSDFILSF